MAMSKRTPAIMLIITFSILTAATPTASAQDVSAFDVFLYSPAEGVLYTNSPLTIKLTIAVYSYSSSLPDVFMNYSLDGISNGSIPFGVVPSAFHSNPIMVWCDGLSKLNVSQGIHSLTITTGANSLPLNITVVHFAVNFSEPPVISNLSIQNKTYKTNSLPLEFVTNEPTTWTSYSLDNGPNIPIQGNTSLSNLADGSHNLVVYANDTVGNFGKSDAVFFTIDTPTPMPTPSPSPSPSLSPSPTLIPSPTQQPTTKPTQTPDRPKIGDFAPVIIPATMILLAIIAVGLLVLFSKRRGNKQ